MIWLNLMIAIDFSALTGARCFLPLFILTIFSRFQKFPVNENFKFISSDIFLIAVSAFALIELFHSKFILFNAFFNAVYTFLKPIISIFISFLVLSPGYSGILKILYALAIAVILSITIALPFHFGKMRILIYETKNKSRLLYFIKNFILDILVVIFAIQALFFPFLVFLLIVIYIILIMQAIKRPAP